MQDIGMDDVPAVGGKNASLGELIRSVVPKGVRVPKGFCVTADAYYYFLKQTGLDVFISKTLDKLFLSSSRRMNQEPRPRGDGVWKRMRMGSLPKR